MELEKYKNFFLDKYNAERSKEKALTNSINAALQHNKLYNKNLDINIKLQIKHEWKSQLEYLSEKHKTNKQTLEKYESDIVLLKETMNNKFQHYFNKETECYRVSHAQKSIGLYLKYLWCLGYIQEPPACPIDRIILTKAKAPHNNRSWGKINSIYHHKEQFSIIASAAEKAKLTPAEWELLSFNS